MLEHWGNSNAGIKLKKMCITHFSTLMENHYSKFICDLFINRSNIEEKKIVLAILLKNKQNINLFNNNIKSHDFANKFDIDNKNNKNNKKTNLIKGEINQINNINKYNNNNIHLNNDAKPFYPKKRNNKGK